MRADVDGDEASAANEVARYYRYFHDQPENADQEQMANVEEMLRYLTYSAGWQGLDGPPDAESRPFDFWDGVDPHWRGDARRGEVARGEHATPGAAAATSSVEGEVVEAEVVGGCEEAEKGSVTPAGDGGEGAVKRQQPQTLEDIDAMTKEEALNSVRAMGDSEDFDDDVQYPPVPMERLGVPLQEGEGRRHGYVVEPWRDAIDVALEDDGPGPEDPEAVREHGVQLAEALRRMRVAREAAAASGEEFTAGAIEEEEVEELPEEAAKREAVQQDFAAAVDGDVGKVPWKTPYDDVRLCWVLCCDALFSFPLRFVPAHVRSVDDAAGGGDGVWRCTGATHLPRHRTLARLRWCPRVAVCREPELGWAWTPAVLCCHPPRLHHYTADGSGHRRPRGAPAPQRGSLALPAHPCSLCDCVFVRPHVGLL